MHSNVLRLEDYCRNDLEQRHRKRLYSRFAKSLIHNFQIPEGDNLVIVLGHGNEQNNLEAMQTWVTRNLPSGVIVDNRDTLLSLTRKLHYFLAQFQEGFDG